MTTPVALDPSTDFLRLREPTWRRFHARHPVYPRDRFEDAYSEWWTREVARHAGGRASRPVKPVAFLADGVHRVLIDEGRALARGLARGEEKHALTVIGLHELDSDPAGDTGAEARYQLLVHRVLDLVREALTPRELSVFVASYLYLQPVSVAARSLGLSVPRVKKDRVRIAGKVGESVWTILSSELDLCAAYEAHKLPVVLELLTVHVDGCPHCRAQLQGVRGSAHAVVGPLELLAITGVAGGAGISGAADEAGDRLSDAWHDVGARLTGLGHRAVEVAASVPPAGRTAAVVGSVAAALGGGVAVERTHPDREPAAVGRAATPRPTPARTARPARTRTPAPTATARPRSRPTAAPTAAPTVVPARPPATSSPSGSGSGGGGGEFGFEG